MSRNAPTTVLEHHMIKVIMSLYTSAAKTDLDDLRDDLRDSAALLMRLVLNESPETVLKDWCDRTLALLDVFGDVDGRVIYPSRLSILRLRSVISSVISIGSEVDREVAPKKAVSMKAQLSALNDNSKRVLEFIGENPDSRTKEIVLHFSPGVSARTVKRILKELVDGGMLQRRQHEGGVIYKVGGPESS